MPFRISRTHVVWLVLGVWTAGWTVAYLGTAGGSWHYFDTGARALLAFGSPDGGWHVYRANPDLQFGPVSLVAAIPFTAFPTDVAVGVVGVLASFTALLILVAGTRLMPRRDLLRIVPVGLVFVPVWERLAVAAEHVDDVIALAATVWAIVAIRRNRPLAAAILLAVAADAKPWALAFAPLLLALHGRRITAFVVWGAIVVGLWLPFFVADHGTARILGYQIRVAPNSVLRLLGVHDFATPWWCRPLQFLLGGVLAVLLWWTGRSVGVVAVVLAVRLALDPATWTYYTPGLLVGTALIDLARRGDRFALPWTTAVACFLVVVPSTGQEVWGLDARAQALLRLASCAAVVVLAFTVPLREPGRWPARRQPQERAPDRPALSAGRGGLG